VFFLSVGLLIDLQYLKEQIWVILAALVVVTGGKTFLSWLLLMIAGEPFDLSVQASLFLSQVGNFPLSSPAPGWRWRGQPRRPQARHRGDRHVLLVSPIWFLMARVMHRLILSRANTWASIWRASGYGRARSPLRPAQSGILIRESRP